MLRPLKRPRNDVLKMREKLTVVYVCIVLISIITALAPITVFAAHFVEDKDGKIKVIEDEGDQFKQTSGFASEEDHLSKDVIRKDSLRRELYIKIVNEGVACAEQGQYAQAIEKYEAAIKLEPDLSYAYINIANAYWHLKKYEESITMSKKALQIDPSDARAYGNIGNAYYSSGKRNEAKDAYKKAKELYKESVDLEGVKKMDEYLRRF